MADTTVMRTKTEAERLYEVWRHTRAKWDMALYDPAGFDGPGLSDEASAQYCDADADALKAFFRCPASNLRDLARKLRVFCEEDAHQLKGAREIMTALAKDASDLAFDGACK